MLDRWASEIEVIRVDFYCLLSDTRVKRLDINDGILFNIMLTLE